MSQEYLQVSSNTATVDIQQTSSLELPDIFFPIDPLISKLPGMHQRYPTILRKFIRTCRALSILDSLYKTNVRSWNGALGTSGNPFTATSSAPSSLPSTTEIKRGYKSENGADSYQVLYMDTSEDVAETEFPIWGRHAMVLAHIAARRTDDPKLGVGSVLVECNVFAKNGDNWSGGKYLSVGWNGYPKKAQHLDYPQAGADDSVEDEELKYDYILHSGRFYPNHTWRGARY
jgi:deoxycytidylate deaminase